MTVPRTLWGLVLGLVFACGCAVADHDDGAGGDLPTAAVSEADLDILLRLKKLPGISNVEETTEAFESNQPTDTQVVRKFEFEIEQPIDHENPKLGSFQMRAALTHVDGSAPTRFETSGYDLGGAGGGSIWNVPGNELTLENRFFGASTPARDPESHEPPDDFWRYLTARQAAADYHQLIDTFKALYTGPWLSGGHSKGGIAALFHRRFYPNDVEGTVVLGAPAAHGIDDPRFEEFLEQVGTASCRAAVVALQREALSRRRELLDVFAREAEKLGLTFAVLGREVAFEHFVEDYRFKFWQTPGPATVCPLTGDPSSMTAESILSELAVFSSVGFGSDQRLRGADSLEAYYYQAATELGDHGPLERHLEDLIEFPGSYSARAYAPKTASTFDPQVMQDLESWVLRESQRIIFVYGAVDPWRAGAFEVPSARDVESFLVPGETHGASLTHRQLLAADRERAELLLQAWTGLPHKLSP